LRLDNIGNSFYGYLVKNPKTHVIFLILDNQKNKLQFLKQIEDFKLKLDFLPTIVSDIKDPATRDRLNALSENRSIYVQKSGPTLSALMCVLPLQRLAYDLTLALGQNPDRPRNLAKELTTQ